MKAFNAVASWTWACGDDKCSICRTHLTDLCITCQANVGPSAECNAAWGKCNHAYHHHCISEWLRGGEGRGCPLCHQPWELERIGDA